MQPRPRADELLSTVAEVLELEIVPALTGQPQHQARVAANLVAIVERELRLAPANARRELALLQQVLDERSDDLEELRGRLARELRSGMADDPYRATEVWSALMAVARDDLTICKPGHDQWEAE